MGSEPILNLGVEDLRKINLPHPFFKGHPIGLCTKFRLSSFGGFVAYFDCGIGEGGAFDIYFDVAESLP
jgi:hypothetical protein